MKLFLNILVLKYQRICLSASRILQKRTRIFKYDVFWKSVFVIFFVIVFKSKHDKIRLKSILNMLGRIVIFSKNMKYAMVFVLTNTFKYVYVC